MTSSYSQCKLASPLAAAMTFAYADGKITFAQLLASLAPALTGATSRCAAPVRGGLAA
ncbi:hypothetical protein JQK87_09820 [Streptomyces sp. G44]|uniref:hypothetical protein n=1 Tax=Streptomyces sp. G44 TaxID=2807632 RepID=UPI0019606CBD|nr:hypothetical protein [Streptomyces sp. G44]MBM7168702.1 hypothetical protein [Streptomyces sp. G44]